MYRIGRTHLLSNSKHAKVNSSGQGLGLCYNFGLVTTDPSKVDCKNCLKRLSESKNEAD